MEIYKDLSSPATKQFEELLNSQLSKNQIEEGKVIESGNHEELLKNELQYYKLWNVQTGKR